MLTFDKYSADCERLGIESPYKSEYEFNRAYGIIERAEPIMVRPKKDDRPRAATLKEHEKPKKAVVKKRLTTQKKPKVPKEPKPKKEPKPEGEKYAWQKRPKKTEEEKQATKAARLQREYEARKKKRAERSNGRYTPRAVLESMTPEELKAHKKKLRLEQGRRYREKLKQDEERLRIKQEKVKEYGREYAKRNRAKKAEQQKRWREANKEKYEEAQRKYYEENKEKRLEYMREYKKRKSAENVQ